MKKKGLKVKIPIKNEEKSQAQLIKESTKQAPPPQKILDDDRWTVYFKLDDRFGQPKAYGEKIFGHMISSFCFIYHLYDTAFHS